MKLRLLASAAFALLTLAACSEHARVTAPLTERHGPALTIQASDVCNGVSTPVAQCEALVALYNSTDGPNWTISPFATNTTPWGANTNPCTWYGVECTDGDAGAIRTLNLVLSDLNGTIPPQIGNLASLISLELDGNHLSGAIPAQLGMLASLVNLTLNDNDLTGPIPPELGNLTNIVQIQITRNHLSGSIPAALGNLGALRFFYLDDNELTGSIPAGLGDATALEALGFGSNNLSGTIPPELGNLTNLDLLHLSHNQLSGPIPAELGNITGLAHLELADNQLTGLIPDALGNLTGLSLLRLDGNALTGLMPLPVAILGDPMTNCQVVPGNEGLFMPDLEAWRDADQDGDGQICGLGFSTAQDIGDDAVDDVNDLVPETLNPGQANALTTKIEHAEAKAAAGDYATAINMLQSFLQQLSQMVGDGTLTAEQAAPFQQQAEALIQIWTQML